MSESAQSGIVDIPEPGKLLYKSELFDVIVRSKQKQAGLLSDRFLVAVELLENDPTLERIALLDIPEDVWRQLQIGERCQARLYEQSNGSWTTKPPIALP